MIIDINLLIWILDFANIMNWLRFFIKRILPMITFLTLYRTKSIRLFNLWGFYIWIFILLIFIIIVMINLILLLEVNRMLWLGFIRRRRSSCVWESFQFSAVSHHNRLPITDNNTYTIPTDIVRKNILILGRIRIFCIYLLFGIINFLHRVVEDSRVLMFLQFCDIQRVVVWNSFIKIIIFLLSFPK